MIVLSFWEKDKLKTHIEKSMRRTLLMKFKYQIVTIHLILLSTKSSPRSNSKLLNYRLMWFWSPERSKVWCSVMFDF